MGRPYAATLMLVFFVTSALDALAADQRSDRIQLLRDRLPGMKASIDRLKANGQDVSYPMVTYTVLENFTGYAQEDLDRGETARGLMAISDMERMTSRLEAKLTKAQSDHMTFPSVPRWTGQKRPVVKDGSFVGEVSLSDGRVQRNRPIFFNGYGHFGQVVADMEKWPDYGTNIIQIEIGPSAIFPTEGQVNLEPATRLIAALDRAQRAGVGICLLISPHYFPDWAKTKHPELAKKRIGFLQYCLHAPEGQKLLTDYIGTFLPVIKDHPALNSICLSNEPINAEEPCEYAANLWHEWLQKRHGQVSSLNERWGARYTSFDSVALPDPFSQEDRSDTNSWIDFVRFNQEFFAGWHKMLADAVHSVAPDLPVHAKAMTWTMIGDDPAYGVDAYLFGKMSQINGNDSANWYSFGKGDFAQGWQVNGLYDLQRSVLNAPVFNTENHVIIDRERRYVPASHIRSALWQAAIHGQCGSTIWVWERSFDPPHDFYGSIMHRPECAEAVGLANLDMNRAALEITAIQRAPAQVQILQSTTSWVRDGQSYRDCLESLYTALSFTGLKIGFIGERQLEDGVLPKAPVVIVPDVTHLSEKAYSALARYKGRLVMVGENCLTRDEYDRPRTIALAADRSISPAAWRDLWKALLTRLPSWRLSAQVDVLDADDQPVWGVTWRGADTREGAIVNLCNERHDLVTIKLIRKGRPVKAVDVLTGEPVEGTFVLLPLDVKLVRIRP